MLSTFITSFKLKNTYRTNSIIYSLKSIPLIKKLLPDTLYGSASLKKAANIISILIELGTVFLGKILYIAAMIIGPAALMKAAQSGSFLHMFFFLTIGGGFLNTKLFDPSKDKYYAMFLMRMDAGKYTVSNYIYFLIKMFLGFLPFTLFFGLTYGFSTWLCLFIPAYVCAVKIILGALTLADCKKGTKVKNENLPQAIIWIAVVLVLAASYIPPYFGYVISKDTFAVLGILAVIAAIPCFIYIYRYKFYRTVYKGLLAPGNLIDINQNRGKAMQDVYHKKIEADFTKISNKTGYKYFNELFMRRHSKIITKSAKRITVILLIALAAAVGICFIFPEAKSKINELMLMFLPYFLFVMYMINRGETITQAMFVNCDHSMLTYGFYRQPKAILSLFAERLKYIAAINLMPASVIAAALPLLLYISGGTDEILNYVMLFVSIIAMSVFFSVHTLVLYYLLQPYNINLEMKNSTYGIASSLTYFVCYFAIGKEMSTVYFGAVISIFCVVYVIAALILAYRLAPKTFRLKQ